MLFSVNAYGNFAAECHSKPEVTKTKAEVNWVGALMQQQELQLVESNVNKRATVCESVGEQSCKNILLDSGATQTVVRREMVDPNSFTGEHNIARSFNGIRHSFLLARTSVRVDGDEHNLEILVADDLCYDALLGCDVLELWEIGKRLLYDALAWYAPEANRQSHSKNSHHHTKTQRSAV